MGEILVCLKCKEKMWVGFPGRGVASIAEEKKISYEEAIEEYYKELESMKPKKPLLKETPDTCPFCGAEKKYLSISGYFD